MRIGNLRLTLVDDGIFHLDGGAMFGVVPKTLWQAKTTPDAQNRIRMVTNCALIESGDDLILVDTAVGDKNDARFREIFGMREDARRLPEAIEAAGYALGDVTHVLLTHLHFDHCGWNTRVDAHGKLAPTFPKARYVINRGEVEHARAPNARDRASYDGRNWEPLFEAGVVELFDDEVEVAPGVRAVRTPGHNRDMCIVLLDGGPVSQGAGEDPVQAKGAIWADLVPTAAHVSLPWIMAYDLFPMETLANKEKWLPLAARENWICVFEHDPDVPVGRIRADARGRLEAVPVEA